MKHICIDALVLSRRTLFSYFIPKLQMRSPLKLKEVAAVWFSTNGYEFFTTGNAWPAKV
jgi:hypothetical protein